MLVSSKSWLILLTLTNTTLLRIDKGEDEYTIILDEWIPDFTVDEEVLLFLMRDDSDFKTDEDYYVLSANEQAKYEIHKDELQQPVHLKTKPLI